MGKITALAGALLFACTASAQVGETLPPPPPPPPPPSEEPPAATPPPSPSYHPEQPAQAVGEPAPSAPGTAAPPAAAAPPAPAQQPPAAAQAAPPPATAPKEPGPAPAEQAAAPAPPRDDVLGDGPVAPAGAPAAPVTPDQKTSHWKFTIGSGIAGRWGGMALSSSERNSSVMIYFGGQADGLWTTEGFGRAARLRLRFYTGGEDVLFAPSDGDMEAAFVLGKRPELRFVAGRVEFARYPGLALQSLVQVATVPSIEGSVTFSDGRMRFAYALTPIELAYVYYYGNAHIDSTSGWRSETDSPEAATAIRLRYTAVVPPSVILSVEGDWMKMWEKADGWLGFEGSAGVAVLDGSVLVSALISVQRYTRRGLEQDSKQTEEEVKFLGSATLMF